MSRARSLGSAGERSYSPDISIHRSLLVSTDLADSLEPNARDLDRVDQLEVNSIYCGDARTALSKLDDESIHLSVWSPPYFVGKSYEKDLDFSEWQSLLREVIADHGRVLVEGGFMVINIADILCFSDDSMPRIQAEVISDRRLKITREEVLEAQREFPHYNRYQLAEHLGVSEQTVDRRLNGNNIRGGKYAAQTRVQLVGGLVQGWGSDAGLHLYDRRVWVKDPAWQNSRWHTTSYRSIDEFEYLYVFWKPGITEVDRRKLSRDEWRDWGSRGVWRIPSVRANDDHEAKFPVELAQRTVRLWSAEGDAILDPFVGSGSSCVAALQEDRTFIGVDVVPEYADLAAKNCYKAAVGKAASA